MLPSQQVRMMQVKLFSLGGNRMQDPTEGRYMISVLDAAKVLGISRSYAYLMANTGELPTVRLGRRILVPVASLRDLAGLDR